MSQRTHEFVRRIWTAGLAGLALTAAARAHDVTPTSVSIPPGGENGFYVVDTFGCPATITATSLYPNVVQVYAVNMNSPTSLLPGGGAQISVPNRVDQFFVVRVSANATPMTAQINVCWVGSTAPNPPCPENNCNPPMPHVVTVQIDATAKSAGSTPFCGIVGDPLASDDAELFFDEPADLVLRGPMPLAFQRGYASRLLADGVAAGSLGLNWMHDFDWRLSELGSAVQIVMPTGRVLRFERVFGQVAWKQTVYEDLPFQLVDSATNKVLGDPRTGMLRTFDSSGRLITIADGKGNAHALSYAGANLSSVADGLGATLTFGYTSSRLTSVTDGTRSVSFGYTSGLLTSATDARGKTTSYAYSAAHPGQALLTSRMRPEGNVPWTQSYDGMNHVATQTDAFAHTTSLSINPTTRETTVTDPLAHEQVHTHSASAELGELEDEGGSSATMTYDTKKRRTAVTDRLGRTTSWTWHAPSGQLASVTAPNGAKTSYAYTARSSGGFTFYDLTAITRPDATTEAFQYDALGNLTRWTDPAGGAWNYTYNARGQTLTATNPLGGLTTNAYDANGMLASATDDAGNTTSFAYDALRRLTTLTRPDTATVAYTYDANDHPLTVTDELSRTTTFVYDDNGNLVMVTDPTTATVTLTYDSMDQLMGVTDALGHSAVTTFDELGRPMTFNSAAGEMLSLGYDARGRLAMISDELSNVWTSSYDAEGVPTATTDPLSNTTTSTNDALGRPTAITSPLGHRVQFAYDSLGRLTQARDNGGAATTIGYDARGLPASVSLPVAGATASVTRNGLGEITAVNQPGAADSSIAYDLQGRPTSTTDPLGRTTSYAYDSRNRVDQTTLPGALGSIDFTWDDADQLTRAQYADGTDLNFVYDDNGRLTSANGLALAYDAAGNLSDSNGMLIGRDPTGRIAMIELAPGKTVTYAYDERGLLTSIADWIGGVTAFAYDAAGRLLSLTRPNGIVTSYTYDADSRVTAIDETPASPFPAFGPATPISQIGVMYDARGNVARVDRNTPRSALPTLATKAYSYDEAGQIVDWVFDELGREVFRDDFWVNDDGYWANADGGYWANYDSGSRVTRLKLAPLFRTYQYDALDEMVHHVDASKDESYVRNYAFGNRPISVVRTGGGVDQTYYVHTPAGGLLYSVDAANDQRSFFHFDERFWTNFLSDDNGAVTDSYAYSPFGTELAHNGTTRNRFTFRGYFGVKREHAALYSFKGRFYDADAARYLCIPQRQILIDPANPNPYAFSRGNPLAEIADAALVAPYSKSGEFAVSASLTSSWISRQKLLLPYVTAGPDVRSGAQIAGANTGFFESGTSSFYSANASTSASSFQGYMLAQTNFATSHGYAFVADEGARSFASSYLALVLPNAAQARSGPPIGATMDRTPHNYTAIVDKLRRKFPQRQTIAFRRDGGQFWFSNEDQAEVLEKILGGRSLNENYWIFLGSQTASTVESPTSAWQRVSRLGLPLLNEAPVVGGLFRNDREQRERRSLLIQVRPTLVHGDL